MKNIYTSISFIFIIHLLISCGAVGTTTAPIISERRVENFGSNWEFQRVNENNQQWEEVNIPHTTRIEPLVVNDQWQGTAIYRKSFAVDNLAQKWFFHFEGVMQEARVTINDTEVMTHKGGFLPFTVDATPYLTEGLNNSIEVVVINKDDPTIPPGKPLEDLDFNLYGGIYRNVHLIKTHPVHITDAVHANEVNGGGVLVHFETVTDQVAMGIVKTHVKNESTSEQRVQLRIMFSDQGGRNTEFVSEIHPVNSGEDISITEKISIEQPFLWSVTDPHLYEVSVEVYLDGVAVDTKIFRTGIRDIQLTGHAFYLNGQELFINGTNRHQEYPYVGFALSDEAQYRDAYKIKNAGFNFVRLSHYPHAKAFLEACDELGLLVMNAIPGWQFYEDGEFAENAIQDIRDMVRRDRNHPSVVFWENSLNESGMPDEFMERANRVLEEELPYEHIYSAGWIDHPSFDLFIPARQHAKPPHYWNNYNKPNRPILIAEYGDWEYYAQNAGLNQTAFSDLQEEERTSRQLRGDGEARLLQQALNFQEAFNSNLRGEQTIGHANWLMFDYNRGYADDLEASGISDIFRIPKFSYYFYKSQKAPNIDGFSEPMIFIANYWTPNSTTEVKVFSNTEEVALYLNDELIERKSPEKNQMSDELPYPPFLFELPPFQPGTLRAVGYIGGEEAASHIVRTPEAPANIKLSMDISGREIAAQTPDMVFVYAHIIDKNGTLVPTASHPVKFFIEGNHENAQLIGDVINAEAGIATVILKTESFTVPIVIRAEADGLGVASITIGNN